jgi:hypothetical protein
MSSPFRTAILQGMVLLIGVASDRTGLGGAGRAWHAMYDVQAVRADFPILSRR